RRRRDPPDHRQGARRRPRVFARRKVHLLQLGAHRQHADLAHAPRRYGAGADHVRRLQQLVPPHFSGRAMDGVSHLRKRSERPPRKQERDAAANVAGGQKDQRAGPAVRWTRHYQRALVVACQQETGLRQLSVDLVAVRTRASQGPLISRLDRAYSIGSTRGIGSADLRSRSCTTMMAASTITIPSTCSGRITSPSAMAAIKMENTGSRQLTTMARAGWRWCKPAK